jgi:hypothetical protein
MSARRLAALTVLLVFTVAAHAEDALKGVITFKVGDKQPTTFTGKTQEVERFQTIEINVDRTALATAAANRQGLAGAGPELTERIEFLKTATQAFADAERNGLVKLRAAADALTAAIRSGDTARTNAARQQMNAAAGAFADEMIPLFDRIEADKQKDPQLFAELEAAVLQTDGYGAMATVLQRHIDQVTAALLAKLENPVEIAIAATLVPPDDAQRALALRPYNDVEELAADAVPSPFPVVDDRTRREIEAAQQFRDVIVDLKKVQDELQKTLDELRQSLTQLGDELKTDVLEKNLDALVGTLRQEGNAALAPTLQQAERTRDLVRSLAGPNLQLTGTTDAQRLLFLANTLSNEADALSQAVRALPDALRELATQLRSSAVLAGKQTVKDALQTIDTTAGAFVQKQTFFTTLASNIVSLANKFHRNATVVRSAENLAAAARSITEADLDTSLHLAKIVGDVHVGDHVIIDAALYQKDPATGKRETIAEETERFIIQRYGFYADNVRGGLLFVEPRSKIARDVDYQPVPALGYFWRKGFVGRAALNRALPAFGLSLSLLDFEDANELELGIAGTLSLYELFWTGYGRNLQAKANYFFVGVNPLAFGRFFPGR